MRWNLFIDADDTLWENFAFFEAGREAFLDYVHQRGLDRDRMGEMLSVIDRERVHEFGFGAAGFREAMRRTMVAGLEEQGQHPVQTDEATLDRIQEEIRSHPILPYPDVEDTLLALGHCHTLFLVTKGWAEEQTAKLKRSGLLHHFERSFVVPDKTVDTYRDLLNELKVESETAWMIGNSPRSDINPAAAAGMGTVLLEKERSWDYEEVPLVHNGRFHRIHAFGELLGLFECGAHA